VIDVLNPEMGAFIDGIFLTHHRRLVLDTVGAALT